MTQKVKLVNDTSREGVDVLPFTIQAFTADGNVFEDSDVAVGGEKVIDMWADGRDTVNLTLTLVKPEVETDNTENETENSADTENTGGGEE